MLSPADAGRKNLVIKTHFRLASDDRRMSWIRPSAPGRTDGSETRSELSRSAVVDGQGLSARRANSPSPSVRFRLVPPNCGLRSPRNSDRRKGVNWNLLLPSSAQNRGAAVPRLADGGPGDRPVAIIRQLIAQRILRGASVGAKLTRLSMCASWRRKCPAQNGNRRA